MSEAILPPASARSASEAELSVPLLWCYGANATPANYGRAVAAVLSLVGHEVDEMVIRVRKRELQIYAPGARPIDREALRRAIDDVVAPVAVVCDPEMWANIQRQREGASPPQAALPADQTVPSTPPSPAP